MAETVLPVRPDLPHWRTGSGFRPASDPVGAISVHGVCGAFGTLAVGFFATEGGLLTGGGSSLLATQAIGVVSVFAFVTIAAGILFLGIKHTIGLRVDAEEELAGLDVFEHGAPGYNFSSDGRGESMAGLTIDMAESVPDHVPSMAD